MINRGTMLALLTALIVACSGGDHPITAPPIDDRRSATPTISETPTPAPMPLQNPIGGAPDGYITYMDEAQGFALHYPSLWHPTPDAGGAAIVITGPGGMPRIAVFRTMETRDSTLEERLQDAVQEFQGAFPESTVEPFEPVTLKDGQRAMRSDIVLFQQGIEMVVRMQITAQNLLTYLITLSAPRSLVNAESKRIETTLHSLATFSPAEFGIARERALVMPWRNPITLDPSMSRETTSHLYVAHLFSGLTRFDEALRVQLDLAENVEIDDSSKVYTFTLREDITFHDGRPITAEDVRYSIERATDPDLLSDTAKTYLGDIVGVAAKLAGEVNEVEGIEVLNSRTIRFTIDAPKAYFLAKLTYPTAAVVDRESVESNGVEWWKDDLNGSGPFKLQEWTDREVLVMRRFDNYPVPSMLEYAIFPLQAGVPVQMYEAGFTDVAFVAGPDVDRAQDPAASFYGELRVFPQFSTSYVGFNVREPPFEDPKIRRAFAMTIDRERLAEVVFQGEVTVAEGLLPPGIPGYSVDIGGIVFDPEAARSLVATSAYAGGLPEITYTANGLGGIGPSVQFMIEAWRKHLGVEVNVHLLEQDAYFYQLADQVDNMFSYAWQADYPDPQNFLDVLLHSRSIDNNIGGYANAEFDGLLEQARVEQDSSSRMSLYSQAEQLLLDDAGIIPLYHSPDYVLTKPYVQGFTIGPLGIPLLQNVVIGER